MYTPEFLKKDPTYLKEMEEKLKVEKDFYIKQQKMDPVQIEKCCSVENTLFGEPFRKRFILPPQNPEQVREAINLNLQTVSQHIFHPIEFFNRQPKETQPAHYAKSFNQIYQDLSCENISILCNPVESLFVTLAKQTWNQRLDEFKKGRVLTTCQLISHSNQPEGPPSFEEEQQRKENDCRFHLQQVNSCYCQLFQQLSSTN